MIARIVLDPLTLSPERPLLDWTARGIEPVCRGQPAIPGCAQALPNHPPPSVIVEIDLRAIGQQMVPQQTGNVILKLMLARDGIRNRDQQTPLIIAITYPAPSGVLRER